jgi:hypothetical protein
MLHPMIFIEIRNLMMHDGPINYGQKASITLIWKCNVMGAIPSKISNK